MHTILDSLTASCDVSISYVPLPGEPDPGAHFPVPAVYKVAPKAELDPAREATAALKQVGDRRASVLMPGSRFDALGTRHGRGGGWYDRFLSQVPAEWLRIAFCYSDQFSSVPLKREAWDQPMDYVCVIDRESGSAEWTRTSARV